MRRTQARQVDGSPGQSLAEMTCRVCGQAGVTIIAMGHNANGAIERHYCGPSHAMIEGWPWLKSERAERDPQPDAQGSLFEPRA